jgi:hypothetical protein
VAQEHIDGKVPGMDGIRGRIDTEVEGAPRSIGDLFERLARELVDETAISELFSERHGGTIA